jgi:hypothetical protein
MRLINVDTLRLEEYFGDDRPQYAILSHTWGGEEVTLQEWQSLNRPSNKAGHDKIVTACRRALADGLRYLWCDTSCIDKTSSAELSEAINSMFRWYQEANICYGYLADVNDRASVAASRWMTRGWTLQELLAPKAIHFYSSDWTPLGDRKDLTQELLKGTGIPAEFLAGRPVHDASVAQRMSWLAPRRTTRVEDMAYCMLGIFDINMPPLYGDGRKAFLRLQEEIIRVSNDHTIFCWTWTPERVPAGWGSMLAPSPHVFGSAQDYRPVAPFYMHESEPSSYTISNGGLSINLRGSEAYSTTFVSLNAMSKNKGYLSLALRRHGSKNSNLWVRDSYPRTPVSLDRIWDKWVIPFVIPTRFALDHNPALQQASSGAVHAARTKHAILILFDWRAYVSADGPDDVLHREGLWRGNDSVFCLSSTNQLGVSRGIISFKIQHHTQNGAYGRRLTVFFAAVETSLEIIVFFVKHFQNLLVTGPYRTIPPGGSRRPT